MKGKHSQSAATRREYQEIEAQAAAAQKRADDLNAMHLREMSTWQRKIDALQRENETLRQQVADGTSGQIADLERVNEKLITERDELALTLRKAQNTTTRSLKALMSAYRRAGMNHQDAVDCVASINGGHEAMLVGEGVPLTFGSPNMSPGQIKRAHQMLNSGRRAGGPKSGRIRDEVLAAEGIEISPDGLDLARMRTTEAE